MLTPVWYSGTRGGTEPPGKEHMSNPFDVINRETAVAVLEADNLPERMYVASPASRKYLHDLMLEKAEATGQDRVQAEAAIDAWLEGKDQRTVSTHIDRLKAEGYTGRKRQVEQNGAAAQPAPTQHYTSVVSGRYAIPTQEGASNEIAFYKVDRVDEGKWAGWTFVRRLVGPEEQKVPQKQVMGILKRIAEFGVAEASKLYGKEIGHCGVCGLRLTNDESREAGIGPICASKMGW